MRSDQEEGWIPLVQYAAKKGVSLSTLRRYIKASKIEYRVENGRYLLKDDLDSAAEAAAASPDVRGLQEKVKTLEHQLQKAKEEIVELKTLVALYEEKIPGQTGS